MISGSLRRGSVNTAVLQTAARLEVPGVHALLYERAAELPHFNPDDDLGVPPAPVAELRELLRSADAVLLGTPEYAGGLPGTFKNLLDWTIGGGELYGKPVGWINATSRPQEEAGAGAYESLSRVLGYAGAELVEGATRNIRVPRASIGEDGLVSPGRPRSEIAEVLAALAAHVERTRTEGERSGAEDDLRGELLELDERYLRALRDGDCEALERLLAEDFVALAAGSQAPLDRDGLLEAVRAGRTGPADPGAREPLVRAGAEGGVVIGELAGPVRYAHVFTGAPGARRLLFAQTSAG